MDKPTQQLFAFIDTYQAMDDFERLRWHLAHGCSCFPDGSIPLLGETFHEHMPWCPLYYSTDEGWLYFDAYGVVPSKEI